MTDHERHKDVMNAIGKVEGSVYNIYKIINGNGNAGMKTTVDRNTQFRKTASKALWILCGVAVGLVATVVRIVIAGN